MKNIQIGDQVIKGYEFEDLNEEAKNKVLNDHINFWMETREYNPEVKGNFEKTIDEAEKMRTPWFAGSYILDYCYDEIIEEIKINNYLFDVEGDLIPLRYYTNENKHVLRLTSGMEVEVKIA